jgi:surfactin synthase thioesterase subunit
MRWRQVADNPALFEVGLPVYRGDQRALESFR